MSLKLSKEALIVILEVKSPRSITEAYRLLGGTGKLSGSVAKKMREMVPGIDEWVDNNKTKAEETKGEGATKKDGEPQEGKAKFRTSGKSKGAKKVAGKSNYPHSAVNPFRERSNYALAFDVLASFPDGLPLAEWRERYAKAARKSLKLASYDIHVLLTAKNTPSGERHRSCRDGFFIEREGDHVTLKFWRVLPMLPTGTSDSGQTRGVRRYPYVILPLAPPSSPIPDGAMYMEAIVFSLNSHPPAKVLADYCLASGLDPKNFQCQRVAFAKDLKRAGKGWLFVRQEGDSFQMGVDLRDGGKDRD